MTHSPDRQASTSSIAQALRADHEELELLFEQLMATLRGGDGEHIRALWLELDRALEQHLRTEEELILPGFTLVCPVDAARVRREHHEIRARLVELGVDLDLHSLCPDSALGFIETLRRHAAFEVSVLYPWSQTHLSVAEQSNLRGRLDNALHRMGIKAPETRVAREQEWS